MAKFFCPTKLSENISVTPEGYLLCKNVPIARTGVMEYGPGETPLKVGPDGIVYVYREASEVFRKQTIASFEGKSVTIRHPNDFVNPDNWKELTKGTVHNVRKADEKDEDGEEVLLADVLITEATAIGLVKNGLREVSCGYEAEYEQTGEGRGRQTQIVGNHLALVEQGRAGNSYAIRDHIRKGEVIVKETLQKFLKLMSGGKTIDQALSEIQKGAEKGTKFTIKKGKTGDGRETLTIIKQKAKSKDGEGAVSAPVSKKAGSETNVVFDEDAYDELRGMMDAMNEKLNSLKPKSGDEEEEESDDEAVAQEEHEQNGGEDEEEEEHIEDEEESSMEERLKILEAAVKRLAGAGDEEEESEDGLEGEEGEKSQSKAKAGDAAERARAQDAAMAEIIFPGFEFSGKGDIKSKVLKAVMAKDENKAALIKRLNGGKLPVFDGKVNHTFLFNATAELLKLARGTGLSGTKSTDSQPVEFKDVKLEEGMTPEKMNELNAKHYEKKTQ